MIKGLWNKKTFPRMFLNGKVENLNILDKNIVDIGGGDKKSSYHTILKEKGNKFISIDITEDCDFKIDLESDKFPFEDNSQDIIFCFNVMEHIFNYQHLLNEMYRILKQDGKIYFFVPFLVNKHADPYDFFRYTDNALDKLFLNTGFKNIQIETLFGSGKNVHSSMSWIISNNKLFAFGKVLNIFSGVIAETIDKFLNSFNKTRTINKKYILGIYLTASK